MDSEIWPRIEACLYRLVYVSPEVILLPESHFAKNILRGKSGVEFLSNLIAIVFDECHVVADGWGEFRPCYKYIWKLREGLPNVPIVGLSATLTKHQLEEFAHQARLESPRVI